MKLLEWPYFRTDFLVSQGLSPTFAKRFWSKVLITNECWLWTASLDSKGYGNIFKSREDRKVILAPRASWILHFGAIPDGFCVLHHCDIRSCIRPSHLFLGTKQDNADDMLEKGRYRKGKIYYGVDNHMAKLTPSDVHEIRKQLSTGLAQWKIAAAFGVTQMIVSRISQRKLWTHV